jgi:hypothetical protein
MEDNISFEAEVVNGHLRHEELPTDLEGQKVQVSLTARVPAAAEALPAADAEPPAWLNVEKDIYVPLAGKVDVLSGVRVIDKGRGTPCIVVPEELPDE